jgi:hypothetical protein
VQENGKIDMIARKWNFKLVEKMLKVPNKQYIHGSQTLLFS